MAAVTDKDTSRAPWRKSSYSGNGGNCVEVAAWRKASYSNNGGECVEVATWRKPSYNGNGNDCVEAGTADAGQVLVRDTTNRDGAVLSFPTTTWRAFAAGLKRH
jgi:hypothetical protein